MLFRSKGGFQGRIAGIKAASTAPQFGDFQAMRDNDALVDHAQGSAQRLFNGTLATAPQRIEEFVSGIEELEERAPNLQRRGTGNTLQIREAYKISLMQKYMGDMGPLEGQLQWNLDLMEGRFDRLGELTLSADKAVAAERIAQLSTQISRSQINGFSLPNNFQEFEGAENMAPRAIETPEQTSLLSYRAQLQDMPQIGRAHV